MFIAWIIHNDLVGAMHLEHDAEAIARVKAREMTGREFLFDCCDGVLSEDNLSDEGNAFAQVYLDDDNRNGYLSDYMEAATPGLGNSYQVRDDWKIYDRIARRIDRAFRVWRLKRDKPLNWS